MRYCKFLSFFAFEWLVLYVVWGEEIRRLDIKEYIFISKQNYILLECRTVGGEEKRRRVWIIVDKNSGAGSDYRNVRTCEPWKIYCKWKIGETLWKVGETLDKIGKPGNFEEVYFFPVSAPAELFIIDDDGDVGQMTSTYF